MRSVLVLVALVAALCWVSGKVGAWLGRKIGARWIERETTKTYAEIGRRYMAGASLQLAPGIVECSGTCETADTDYVQAWLAGIADRLREAGITFVSTGWLASGGTVRWTVGIADPSNTRDELAAIVGNACEMAGGVPE